MLRGRVLWLGMHLSLAGFVLVLLVQTSSTDAWRVEASCGPSGTVSGSITAEPGSHVIHVAVTYHVPGSSEWLPVPGASQTLNVQGAGPHAFGPLEVSATPATANSIRVEIEVEGDPTNAKSESFKPCGGPPPEPTQTSTVPTPSQTPITPTAPASPSSTGVPATETQPTVTATRRPSTEVPSTATQAPAATAVPTDSPFSQVGGVVRQPTATPTSGPMIRGIPSAGDGGLLAEHRTSLTLLGVALIVVGLGLVAGRGVIDARR